VIVVGGAVDDCGAKTKSAVLSVLREVDGNIGVMLSGDWVLLSSSVASNDGCSPSDIKPSEISNSKLLDCGLVDWTVVSNVETVAKTNPVALADVDSDEDWVELVSRTKKARI
jgi:hypothetical protein